MLLLGVGGVPCSARFFISSSFPKTFRGRSPHLENIEFRIERLKSGPLARSEVFRAPFQEKLRYHFMSPLEKWRSRRIFPWKLIFQVFKIFFVTFQILLFGMDSTQFYKEEAATATALKVSYPKLSEYCLRCLVR